MSTTDPRQKNEKSKYVAGAYTVSNILRSEAHIDQTFKSFLGWLDTYSRTREPMDLSKFISYATFDVIGQIAFSQPFGFLAQGKDINNAISNSLALNAYVAVAGYFRWLNVALLAQAMAAPGSALAELKGARALLADAQKQAAEAELREAEARKEAGDAQRALARAQQAEAEVREARAERDGARAELKKVTLMVGLWLCN